ncbi:protein DETOXIFICATION 25-like [Vitis vinifera]|uniref:protein DETOXIFICATION 25-like n=1 Tax=Vitis vinifera TaxID=29760 RepID=UPI0028831B3D|nr:protein DETOXIFICATION 25-like [Vitis vinifera]
MSSATETLCGQAFGANQYHMMGIYLQRSWIVDAVVATILTCLFIFETPLFELLGQEEEVAIAAGNFSLWFIPILYFYVFTLTIQMYLQAQLKNMIVGWLSASSFVLPVLLSWIFVIKLNLGVPGALGAMIISTWSMVIGELVYIFGGWCPKTWRGFTTAAFTDIPPVLGVMVLCYCTLIGWISEKYIGCNICLLYLHQYLCMGVDVSPWLPRCSMVWLLLTEYLAFFLSSGGITFLPLR